MVLTRLSRSKRWQRPRIYLHCTSTRHLSLPASQSEPATEQHAAEISEAKPRPRKTVKKFADLPKVFIDASGVAAKPLPNWDPSYIVPPPVLVESDEAEPKPKRRTRKKKDDSEVLDDAKPKTRKKMETSETKKVIDSAKAPKPTSFLAREILSNLRRFPHCLLLTRVGNFYESYFDQAVEVAELLNIKLTSRKWNGERVAMCGFPILHLDRYLKVLVQQEQRFVAMCEEFARYDADGFRVFDRRISRIITPGTLIDESFVNPFDNNYLLSISPSSTTPFAGLSWIDVSTGEFFSKQCPMESVHDELARLAPREVVLDTSLQELKDHPIFSILGEGNYLVSYCSPSDPQQLDPSIKVSTTVLVEPIPITADSEDVAPSEGIPDTEPDVRAHSLQARIESELIHGLETMPPEETAAVTLLTHFLKDNLREHMPLLTAPRHEDAKDRMQIDAHTIQGLEIRETSHEGSAKGSLLSVVKRTMTMGGARLLSRWLCSPSTSVQEIIYRQSLVAFLHRRPHFRSDICEILKEMDDVGRLCQRFLLGRADFGDLIAIDNTINTWETLKDRCQQEKAMEHAERRLLSNTVEWDSLETLFQRMTDSSVLSKRITEAIVVNADEPDDAVLGEATPDSDVGNDPSPDVQTQQGEKQEKRWSINPNASKKLFQLSLHLKDLLQQKETMEKNLQEKYNAPSLSLRSGGQQGMFVHLARAKRDRKHIDQDPVFFSMGESITTKSYFYRDWRHLGNNITEATIAVAAAEKEVFDMIRLEVIEQSEKLRQNAHIIDELDVAASFAILAEEMNFVRPEIVEDGSYNVIHGRHPTVEMGLLSSGRQFTPNSVDMTPSSNLHVITGPNMAGKSTFLRQTALIAILAQVGSFVPADYARIGAVDKLFSRIGAKDDLFRDRSTFMVEMLETADILRRATDKSLVIMDEVGRGTTVKDGLAIAFAALHHVATVTRSRCLFATHFHELAEMLGNTDNEQGSGVFHNVRFYCSDVDDVGDGHFAYSYKLQPGINRDSHGLKVARLAGVPPSAMTVATNTLTWLRERGTDRMTEDYDLFLQAALKSDS